MNKVIVHHRAAKYLRKLPVPEKERIKKILQKLEQSALTFPGRKNMTGEWAGYHRIRLSNLRVIFWYDESEHIV